MLVSETIDFLNSHVSVRSFTDQDVSPEDEQTICITAVRSPTSSNLHAYSIIVVRDQGHKELLSDLCGIQDHVAACPLFLVFCADLNRLNQLTVDRNYRSHVDQAEMFIIATVDAALAGGRALIAAQALGMGGVMVGGIRNQPDQVCELLSLPELVYPLMGMSLGYPTESPRVKPRLPLEGLCFSERYRPGAIPGAVTEYDATIDRAGYLKNRVVEKDKYPEFDGVYSWSEHTARRLANDSPSSQRAHMLSFLQARGFLKK